MKPTADGSNANHYPKPGRLIGMDGKLLSTKLSWSCWLKSSSFWQAAAAVVIAVLTVGQVVLFWAQTTIMDNQTTIAGGQSKIADAQARDARTGQRAWLEMTTTNPRPWEYLTPVSGKPVEIEGVITNIGPTPARHIEANYRLEQVSHHKAPAYKSEATWGNRPGWFMKAEVLYPHRDIPLDEAAVREVNPFHEDAIDHVLMTETDVAEWKAGHTYFAFYGEITYCDIFNVRHVTRFCLTYPTPDKIEAAVSAEECLAEYNSADNNQEPEKDSPTSLCPK